MKYLVEYVCDIPEWGDVTLDADNEQEAKDFAIDEIKFLYPEASNIVVENVKAID